MSKQHFVEPTVAPHPPQDKPRPPHTARLSSIPQAERNTGLSLGIVSPPRNAPARFNFAEALEQTERLNRQQEPTAAELGRRSVQQPPASERGRSIRGTMATAPRDTSPNRAQRLPAADVEYDTGHLWRLGSTVAHGPYIQPLTTPPTTPRGGRQQRSAGTSFTTPRSAAAANGYSESLTHSARQARNVKGQVSAEARRQLLRSRGDGSATLVSSPAAHDHSPVAALYYSLGSANHHNNDHHAAATYDTTFTERAEGTVTANGASLRRSPPLVVEPLKQPGWTISKKPRFNPTTAESDAALQDGLNPNYGSVSRHTGGPTMRLQIAPKVFAEHRAAKASSSGGFGTQSTFRGARNHPLPNLRSCVHSRFASPRILDPK
jgi:hypothetical protein